MAIPVVSPSVASLGIKIHLAYLIRTSELAMHGFGFDETEVRVHVAKQRDPFGRNPREISTGAAPAPRQASCEISPAAAVITSLLVR
jgi:hypothetical protein